MSTRNSSVKMAGPAVVQFLYFKNSMLSDYLPCISSVCVSRTKINVNFGGGALLSCNMHALDLVSYMDQFQASRG